MGHVRRNEQGRRAATTPVGNQMRLINSDAIAGDTALSDPVRIHRRADGSARAGRWLQPIQLPDLSEGPHFWYAVQWFMFTAVGVAGIVVFIRADLRALREDREEAPEAHATV